MAWYFVKPFEFEVVINDVMEMLSKMENTRVYPKVSGLATWSEN
jgi:hypothetical protein